MINVIEREGPIHKLNDYEKIYRGHYRYLFSLRNHNIDIYISEIELGYARRKISTYFLIKRNSRGLNLMLIPRHLNSGVPAEIYDMLEKFKGSFEDLAEMM